MEILCDVFTERLQSKHVVRQKVEPERRSLSPDGASVTNENMSPVLHVD